MAAIIFNDFAGMAPIFQPRKLPDAAAQLASDVRMEGAAILPRAYRRAVSTAQSPGAEHGFTYGGFNPGETHSRLMFHERSNGTVELLAWPTSQGRVNAARSPIARDTQDRVYWTRTSGASAWPRYAAAPGIATIRSDSPGSVYRLGVPEPRGPGLVGTPITAAQAAANDVVNFGSVTSISQTSPVTVQLSVAVPFKNGQRVRVIHQPPPGSPPTNGQPTNMSEIGGREFVVDKVNAAGNNFVLVGAAGATWSPLTNPAVIRIERVYTEDDRVTRSYVATFVTTFGEEGPPSPPSTPAEFNIGVPIELTLSGAFDTGWQGRAPINRVRIYRTSTGSERTEFFLLEERPITINSGNTTFFLSPIFDPNDDTLQVLGELLPSTEWQPPPADLRGLTALPNGILAGFVGNTVYFCEPYQPHAWPDRYRRTTNSDIVGLGVYGQTLVIATTGKPYIADGSDSRSMVLQELDEQAPCIEPESIVSVGFGVAWASREGMVVASAGGVQTVTRQLMTRQQWEALQPVGTWWSFNGRRLIAIRPGESPSGFAFELGPGRFDLSLIGGEPGRALALNPRNGTLYYSDGGQLMQLEGNQSLFRPMIWRSKVFTMVKPVNFGAAQVFADAYPVTMRITWSIPGAASQTPALPDQTQTYTVTGPDPFRLAAGFMSREYSVTFETGDGVANARRIVSAVLAESMDEIRAL